MKSNVRFKTVRFAHSTAQELRSPARRFKRGVGQQGQSLVRKLPADYRPPVSRDELERRYAAGERCFPETELSDADLSGIELDGADFERHSWFHSADFSRASLRGTSFRECNLKCANFSDADLTGAVFELAAIEAIKTQGAVLTDVRAKGATFFGCELTEGEALPSWDR